MRLSSGSYFSMSWEEASHLELREGEVLTEQRFEQIRQADALRTAWLKSVELLKRREHSVRQLHMKLAKRGFEEHVIRETCERLEKRRYLDDARFADAWVRATADRKPRGRAWMLARLAGAGVDRETADAALSRCFPEEAEDCALERAAARLSKKKKMNKARMIRGLVSRGFRHAAAVRAAEQAVDERGVAEEQDGWD